MMFCSIITHHRLSPTKFISDEVILRRNMSFYMTDASVKQLVWEVEG